MCADDDWVAFGDSLLAQYSVIVEIGSPDISTPGAVCGRYDGDALPVGQADAFCWPLLLFDWVPVVLLQGPGPVSCHYRVPGLVVGLSALDDSVGTPDFEPVVCHRLIVISSKITRTSWTEFLTYSARRLASSESRLTSSVPLTNGPMIREAGLLFFEFLARCRPHSRVRQAVRV